MDRSSAKRDKKTLEEQALDVVLAIDDVWKRLGGNHHCTICTGSRVTGHSKDCELGKLLKRIGKKIGDRRQ